MNVVTSNRQIAKNTLYMYIRMLLVMFVTLYTSRVVLNVLGIDNYGIYNIVGGVVILFTFFNQAAASATQRYFSYELGKKGNSDMSKIFTMSLRIHIGLAILIFVLAETIGLWFLNNKMNFPDGSIIDVNWVYQFSIGTCVLSILRIPYNSLIISYEKMSFFAISSIVENLLKLGVVYLLIIISVNKLILYSFLILLVTAIITAWYVVFCKKNFGNVRYKSSMYKREVLEMVTFSGWATFGSVANIGYQQGINVLLNIGYGVATNAAVAIATQVNAAIAQFVGGFQQALNPQLIKAESSRDVNRQQSLIFKSAKYSFYIMLVIATPIVVNMGFLLKLWLDDYPPSAIQFSQLIIIGALIECLSGPLWVTIFATGNIRYYQLIISMVLLLNIPISYMLIQSGMAPSIVFVVRIVLYIIALFVRLIFLQRLIDLSILKFVHKVVLPISYVLVPLLLILYAWSIFIGKSMNFIDLIWHSSGLVSMCIFLIFSLGLSREEKKYVLGIIQSRIRR